ncbi:MAG: hypothetical protein K2Q33_06850 [Gammaproteobacteria bacterium]|nr:hypothetical protein [Gammaproteobacteria bacterium]
MNILHRNDCGQLHEFGYTRKKQNFEEWTEWMRHLGITNYGTAAINSKKHSIRTCNVIWDKFHMLVDRELYGPKYHKRKPQDRTVFVATPEHLRSNLHYHAGFVTPDIEGFQRMSPQIWESLVPTGDLKLEDYTDENHKNEFIKYMFKEIWENTSTDTYFVSRGGVFLK